MTELDIDGRRTGQQGRQQDGKLHRGGWEGAPAPAQVGSYGLYILFY